MVLVQAQDSNYYLVEAVVGTADSRSAGSNVVVAAFVMGVMALCKVAAGVDVHTELDRATADQLLACTAVLGVQMSHSGVALAVPMFGAEPWETAVLYTADLPPLPAGLGDQQVMDHVH